MYAHLLVPTDGSKLSDKAVTHAISLAQALHAKISFSMRRPTIRCRPTRMASSTSRCRSASTPGWR